MCINQRRELYVQRPGSRACGYLDAGRPCGGISFKLQHGALSMRAAPYRRGGDIPKTYAGGERTIKDRVIRKAAGGEDESSGERGVDR